MKLIKCKRCGKVWIPRKEPSKIVQCPGCTSKLWMKERKIIKKGE